VLKENDNNKLIIGYVLRVLKKKNIFSIFRIVKITLPIQTSFVQRIS
jgi:hypothetical protein